MLLLSLFNTHTHAQKLKDINNEKMLKSSSDAVTEKMDTIIFRKCMVVKYKVKIRYVKSSKLLLRYAESDVGHAFARQWQSAIVAHSRPAPWLSFFLIGDSSRGWPGGQPCERNNM